MNIVDGRKLAGSILTTVQSRVLALAKSPQMTVIACDPNFETQKYLALKERKAKALGITLKVEVLPKEAKTADIISAITQAAENVSGIVVQLPLPAHIDVVAVLAAVPLTHDVDAFAYQETDTFVLPPVVGAIDEISHHYQVEWTGKRVVIFGSGRLVGAPAQHYAQSRGAEVVVITETTEDVVVHTKEADIIILGVGKPNLLTPEMVRAGVVVFDAGASEDGGLLVGDAHPQVAEHSALFTPVPGGIGPLTIALLFRNLLDLAARQ